MPDAAHLLVFAAPLLTGAFAAALFLCLQPLWEAVTNRYVADFAPQLRDCYAQTPALNLYMQLWGVALFAVPLFGVFVLRQYPLSLLAALLLLTMPRLLVAAHIRKQRTKMRDQLVAACVNLANACRAGLSLPQGLESVIGDTPAPLAFEFNRVIGEFKRGRPFLKCLRDSQLRLAMETYTLFANALIVCQERGGKVTEALDRISKSLLESQRLERKRAAETAAGRRVVSILAVTPLGFLGLFSLMDPYGTRLIFTTPEGQIILALVALLDYISVRWARSILKLDAAAR